MMKDKKERVEIPKKSLKRVILHSKFRDTIKNLSKINLKVIDIKSNIKISRFEEYSITKGTLTYLEENSKYGLDAKNSSEKTKEFPLIASYDESINKFTALEGVAYMTSHSLVFLYDDEYIPTSLITIYFFTRANHFKTQIADGIIITDDTSYTSKEIYVRDKVNFLKDTLLQNTLLFIDGPLIGGDWYVKMIDAVINYLNPNNIIPVFIVKNSTSSIIVDNTPNLKGKYNTDVHWAYYHLKKGERTGFFKYQDKINPRNARIFCYIKAFDTSPLRVEFHPSTFEKYKSIIYNILDTIYYLLLVQGDLSNPQIRPIAIAEKYARETLHLFSLEAIIKKAKLIPTINQERFGWTK